MMRTNQRLATTQTTLEHLSLPWKLLVILYFCVGQVGAWHEFVPTILRPNQWSLSNIKVTQACSVVLYGAIELSHLLIQKKLCAVENRKLKT